jgi:signal transduction histidine kinase
VKRLAKKMNISLGLVLLIGLALLWVLRTIAMPYIIEKQMVTRLSHDFDGILKHLVVSPTGEIHIDSHVITPMYLQLNSGYYYSIVTYRAVVNSPSLGTFSFELEPFTSITSDIFYMQGPELQSLIAFKKSVLINNVLVTVTTSEDLTQVKQDVRDLSLVMLLISVLITLFALLVQSYLIHKALNPFLNLKWRLISLAAIDPNSTTDLNDEDPLLLSNEIQSLLQIIDRRLNQSRASIGNLAHAIKTPLAIMYRLADSTELDGHPDIRSQFQKHASDILNLVERELKRARIAGIGGKDLLGFHPQVELQTLSKVLKTLYRDKPLIITISAPDMLVNYDRQDILELIGNLADNASKWAYEKVNITLKNGQDGLEIIVEDDGPGCSPEIIRELIARGLRASETKEGHGLGLAIVNDIVEFYNGKLVFEKSQTLGGLRVIVYLSLVKS